MRMTTGKIIFFLAGFVLLTNLEINASPSSSEDFDNYNNSNSYSSYIPANTGYTSISPTSTSISYTPTTTAASYSDYKNNPTLGPISEQSFNSINQQQSISGSYLNTTYNAPNYSNLQYMTPIQAYDTVKSLPDNYTGSVPVTVGGNVYSYQMDKGVLSSQATPLAVQNNTVSSYNNYINNSQNFVGPLRSEQMWNDSGKPVSEYALVSNVTSPSYNSLSSQNIQVSAGENMLGGGYYIPSGSQAIVENMVNSAPAGTFVNADSTFDTNKLNSTSIIQPLAATEPKVLDSNVQGKLGESFTFTGSGNEAIVENMVKSYGDSSGPQFLKSDGSNAYLIDRSKLDASVSELMPIESYRKIDAPISELRPIESYQKIDAPTSELRSIESYSKLPISDTKVIESYRKIDSPVSELRPIESYQKIDAPTSKTDSLQDMKFNMPEIKSYNMYVSDPFIVTNNDGKVYQVETWSKETPHGTETSTNYLGLVKSYDFKQTTFTKESPLATGGGSPILTETWTTKTYEPVVNNQGNAMYTKIEVLKNEGATNDLSGLQPVPSYTVPTKNEFLMNKTIDSLIGPSQLPPQTSGGAVMQVRYDSPVNINSGVSNSIQPVTAPQIQPIAPANQDYRINQ